MIDACWCGGRVDSGSCRESKFHDPGATRGRDRGDCRKLYIAGPMSGFPECNYPAFNWAETILRAAGYEVVNPAKISPEGASSYTDLLREDLRLLLDCDGVAVLGGWWGSVGARNEVQVAGLLGMPVEGVGEWEIQARYYRLGESSRADD